MRAKLINAAPAQGRFPCTKPWINGTVLDPRAIARARSNRWQSRLQRFVSTSTALEQRRGHRPKLEQHTTNETVYILTLLTDANHSVSMNSLRKAYFPTRLNKIPAHITLFHALPESKLNDKILPAISKIASCTCPYHIKATHPFKLSKGIAINVTDTTSSTYENHRDHPHGKTDSIHAELRREWSDWLSEQDSRPLKMHYTVMNKVSDQSAIEKALNELKEVFGQTSVAQRASQTKEDHLPISARKTESSDHHTILQNLHLAGEVHGLTLWTYKLSGHWTDPKHFKFERRRS